MKIRNKLGHLSTMSAPVGTVYTCKTHGYVMIRVENHPLFPHRKWVKRARLAMSEYIGRQLESWENVHHKNGNKTDDDLSNLELIDHDSHVSLHLAEREMSESNRQKLIEANINRIWTDEMRKRSSLSHAGKTHSLEARKRMSESQKERRAREKSEGSVTITIKTQEGENVG